MWIRREKHAMKRMRYTWPWRPLALLVSLVLAACSSEGPTGTFAREYNAELRGTVNDAQGLPLAALVTLNLQGVSGGNAPSIQTDAQGQFSFFITQSVLGGATGPSTQTISGVVQATRLVNGIPGTEKASTTVAILFSENVNVIPVTEVAIVFP